MTTINEILDLTAALYRLPDLSDREGSTTGWALAKKDEAETTIATEPKPRTPRALLTAQANTLTTIFDHLAAKASNAQHIQQPDGVLRLALKVQAQCIQTLRVLGEMDSPRQVAFVQQANIANGHQQIINGGNATPFPENDTRANELLELANGWTDERRTKQAAAIQRWKPWARSSGPRTDAGKASSSINARKHGARGSEAKALRLAVQALLSEHISRTLPDT